MVTKHRKGFDMKRNLALLLALLMLMLLVLVACDNKKEEKPGDVNGTDSGREPEAADPYVTVNPDGSLTYNIIAPKFDWGGRVFNILVRSDAGAGNYNDMDFTYKESLMGEPINDAAYRRIIEIEEMYNIKINPIGASNGDHLAKIRASVTSGDKAYDITFNNPRINGTLSREGMLYDLLDFPNIDTKAPWWNQNQIKYASIAGKLYNLAGDISMGIKKTIGVMLFNKKIVTELGLESPYNLIDNNEWTLNKLIQMCKEVWQVNGEGLPDTRSVYGCVGFHGTLTQALFASGIFICEKDEDDIPQLSFYSERLVDAFDVITEFLYDRTLFYNFQQGYASGRDGRTKFINDEAFIFWTEFYQVHNLRAMDTDFGIIPAPKLNAEQERYYHPNNSAEAQVLAIPVGLSDDDKEKVGAIVDALGSMGRNYLLPAYYDISLKGKLTRDVESEKTIDIVFNALYFDVGRVYNIGNMGENFNSIMSSYNRDITSYYKSRESMMQNEIDTMVKQYLELES